MKNRNLINASFVLLLCLFIFSGCEKKNEQDQSPTSSESEAVDASGSSEQSTEKEVEPSDAELNDTVKRTINKEMLPDLPLEITNLSVNWTDKSPYSALGKFSVKTKTTEKLYRSVNNKDGLRKLAVGEQYEGEVNVAREKIYKLPDPHKTNLRNAVPEGNLDRFRFYDVLAPEGSEVTLTGSVELSKYGNDWQADNIRRNSISVEDFVPESQLSNVAKLDDPKTKEAVELIIQERKDFVAKVDATITEVENQRQAEIKRQQEAQDAQYQTILEYIKPGARFEGTWNCTRWGAQSTGITVVFGPYNGDKTAIDGTYYMSGHPELWVAFQLHIKPTKIEQFPIKGKRGIFTKEAKAAWDQLEKIDPAVYKISSSFYHYSMTEMTLGIIDGSLRGNFARDTTVNLGKPVEE